MEVTEYYHKYYDSRGFSPMELWDKSECRVEALRASITETKPIIPQPKCNAEETNSTATLPKGEAERLNGRRQGTERTEHVSASAANTISAVNTISAANASASSSTVHDMDNSYPPEADYGSDTSQI